MITILCIAINHLILVSKWYSYIVYLSKNGKIDINCKKNVNKKTLYTIKFVDFAYNKMVQ